MKKFYLSGRVIASARAKIDGMTQENLAKQIKIPRATLAAWEKKDKAQLTEDQYNAIKEALNIPDNKSATIDDQVDSDNVYRDLVEGNTEYILIPRSVLQEKYRLVSMEQIQKDIEQSRSDKDTITRLMNLVEATTGQIANLHMKLTDGEKS